MNRLSVAVGLCALALGGAASAADLPFKAQPVPAAAPVLDWSGFYLGAHAGYGWGHDPFTMPLNVFFVPLTLSGLDSSGYVAGGQVGYNWQYGRIVAGLELDMSATGIEASTSASGAGTTPFPPPVAVTASATIHDKFDYFGTARGRVGFLPWQNFLVYGTGGLAWTHFVQTMTTSSTSSGITSTNVTVTPSDRFGWVAGIGGEFALASLGLPNWLLRAEYLHYDFGSQASSVTTTTGPDGAGIQNTSDNLTVDVVRGGVSVKFR